jgi:hypothetical protein
MLQLMLTLRGAHLLHGALHYIFIFSSGFTIHHLTIHIFDAELGFRDQIFMNSSQHWLYFLNILYLVYVPRPSYNNSNH